MGSFIVMAVLCAASNLGTSTHSTFKRVTAGLSSEEPSDLISQAVSDEYELTPSITRYAKSRWGLAVQTAFILCAFVLYFYAARKRGDEIQEQVKAVELNKRSVALQKVLTKRNSIFHKVDEDLASIIRGHALVGTYMSTDLLSIEESLPKQVALQKMLDGGFRRFMVTNEKGAFVGVVSKKDILSKNGESVRDVMTSDPKTVTPQCELSSALTLLLENRISCLPVVADANVVGLLSVSDLLMVLQCLLRDLEVRSTQAERQP